MAKVSQPQVDVHGVPFDDPMVAPDAEWGGPSDGYYTGQFDWPLQSLSTEEGVNGVRVSTEALRVFATNLRSMIPALEAVMTNMEGIELKPGHFADAYELVGKVFGAGAAPGIQDTTLEFARNAIQAIVSASDELERLASAYQTAEELNAATGKDLGEHIQNAQSYITAAIGGVTSV